MCEQALDPLHQRLPAGVTTCTLRGARRAWLRVDRLLGLEYFQ